MFIRLVSIFLLSFLFISCHSVKDSKYVADETIFNNYLSSVFQLKINKDSTNYVLISDEGCHGCIEGTIIFLSKFPKSTFILSDVAYKNYSNGIDTNSGSHILIDATSKINRLKYHQNNIGIIQTANGEIYNIVNMDAVNLDSILRSINK